MQLPKLPKRICPIRSVFLLLLVALLTPLHAAPWPPKLDGIEGDPAVVYGQLENGVRWAYLPNAHPEDQLSLRLLVEAGSFMEEDDELGMAHFLEHMAFNGTQHFPAEGQAIETFQRHGLAFGQQLNAMTGFLQTVYQVDLPHLETALLDDAFRFLQDQAHGQVFDEAEIEKERGVILEEMRTRNSPHYRAYFSNLGFLLGEGRFANRSPLGTEATVKSFQKQDFEEFYQKWYTADRLVVLGVGALSAEDFEAQVKAHFAEIPANSEPLPNPTDTIRPPSANAVHFSDTPGSEHMLVQLASLLPVGNEPMTAEKMRENTLHFMSTVFLAIHFNLQVAGGNAPFLQAINDMQEESGLFRLMRLILVTQPNLTMEALDQLAKSVGDLTTNGFDEEQANQLKAMLLANMDGIVQQAATRQNAQLAQAMVGAFSTRGMVFMHPAQEQELLKQWFADWSGKQIGEALKVALEPERAAILLEGKLAQVELDKDEVVAAYQRGLATRSEGKQKKEKLEWAYADFGEPGEIVSQELDPDLNITRIAFANGVRVNLKELSTHQNLINISLRVGEGLASNTDQDRRLALAAPSHLRFGGLGQHSLEEIQQLTLAKQFGIGGMNVGNLALELHAGGLRNVFPMLLELLAAHLIDPGFRASAHAIYQQAIQAQWKDEPSNPMEVYQMRVQPFLFANDWRSRQLSKAEMLSAEVPTTTAWLLPQLREGYLEIGVAGDFETEKLLPELARTFGALPARSTVVPVMEAEDSPQLIEPTREVFRYDGPDPKAALVLTLPVCSGVSWQEATQVEVLAALVQDALNREIREAMGGTYGVSCQASCGWDSTADGQLTIQMECDPERVDAFEAKAMEVLTNLANDGISKDQLKRALRPLIHQEKEYLKDPGHWNGWVLTRSQGTPWFNERMLGRLEVLESTELEALQALASRYLQTDRAVIAQILPNEI